MGDARNRREAGRRTLTVIFALAATLPPFITPCASAQNVADFYHGKIIRLIVGYGAGGGHDSNARLLARYIGQYIPGNPRVLVQNMPGAASLKSVQYLDNGAASDGTVFVTFNSGLLTESLTKPNEVPVNLNSYAWIGSLSQEIRVCFVRTDTGIRTWNDLLRSPGITFGETGRGSASYIDSGILKDVLGVKLKIVFGYAGGSSEKELAVERGELDGDCVSFSSIPKDWIKNGKVVFVSRGSTITPAGLPPDTPYVADLTSDPEKKKLITFLLSPAIIGRPFIASRSVPGDRLSALQEAFAAAAKDPQLLAEAEKLELPVVGSLTGREAAAYVAETARAGAPLIAAARKITGE